MGLIGSYFSRTGKMSENSSEVYFSSFLKTYYVLWIGRHSAVSSGSLSMPV